MGEIKLRLNGFLKRFLYFEPEKNLYHNISAVFLKGSVKCVDNLYLLESQSHQTLFDKTIFLDETGFECFVNKLHIEDLIGNENYTLYDLYYQGLTYLFSLINTLQSEFPSIKFRVILAFDKVSRACTIRFHKIREGQFWINDDIETYLEEGIIDVIIE